MMEAFNNLVVSSVLMRACATVFLFVFLIAVLAVWVARTIQGGTVDPLIWGTIITGASICTTILGINYGVQLQPAKQPAQAAPVSQKLPNLPAEVK